MRIIPEKLEAYKNYLHKNIDTLFGDRDETTKDMPNSYILAIIFVTELAGEVLDAGATPEEAVKAMQVINLTGYMAGLAAAMVVRFNPRGEEFLQYWNEQYGGKKGTTMVLNPKEGMKKNESKH